MVIHITYQGTHQFHSFNTQFITVNTCTIS
ncbi:hypothetical protein F383_25853 [Gossypium arboreum]|uniref:Uncharacterized protein n=1 Tax=Gossypium arboreum TaxID=29729 RepID=A0A0B0P4A0_GOSAR|nr:hypothetical protein F383_25853 [Gossypium arboreum]